MKWQRRAAADGVVRRVFVGSMMDIFEKPFPLIDAQGNALPETTGHLRLRFFEEVVPKCPNLLFLLLTKRPGNILKYIPEEWRATPPANVMYGTSVVDQATADDMIPKLLEVPGRRFLSMEPLIGPVELRLYLGHNLTKKPGSIFFEQDFWYDKPHYICEKGHVYTVKVKSEGLGRDACIECYGTLKPWKPSIDWVIVGGESGHGARPMAQSWARSLRDECLEGETPFHFKQWGEWAPWSEQGPAPGGRKVGFFTNSDVWHEGELNGFRQSMVHVGKHEAGNLLDGRLHQDVPTIDALVANTL
jgi:protein gp37